MVLSFRTDRSSLIMVYTVCQSVCIFWTHYSVVEPHCWNFRITTANFWESEYLGIFSKFLDRQVWSNRRSLIRVYTVCHSICIFWTHYSIVKQYCSNFRKITAIFCMSKYLGIFSMFQCGKPYHNGPKFSDREVLAICIDQDKIW